MADLIVFGGIALLGFLLFRRLARAAKPGFALRFEGEPRYRLVPNEYGDGSGFLVERIEDEQRLSWYRLHEEGVGLHAFDVAGESHYRAAVASDDFAPGSPVDLVPEPMNKHDPNAVAVVSASGEVGGFVPRDEAERFGEIIRRPHAAIVMWGTNNERGKRVALRVLVIEQGCPIIE